MISCPHKWQQRPCNTAKSCSPTYVSLNHNFVDKLLVSSQQALDVYTMSYQCGCYFMMLHQRWCNIVLMLHAEWVLVVSLWKHTCTLWALIRNAWLRCFKENPLHIFFCGEIRKTFIWFPFSHKTKNKQHMVNVLKFRTLYSVLSWPKFCFLCRCFLYYIVKWQTM